MVDQQHIGDEIRSYLRYYRYFWVRFAADGVAWSSENLTGFLLTIAILGSQLYLGVLRPGDANAEFWSIAYPYAALMALWFIFHFTLTAWRLDREREEREGLPIRALAHMSRNSGTATLHIKNR
jgi:hypothetical protein